MYLLALNFGGQTFPWGSAAVIAPLVLTGVLFVALVFVEIKIAKEPLFPPRLFLIRSVFALSLLNLFNGIVFFGIVYYLPIYFQIVRGNSATWSGIRLIPMQLLISTFSTLTGIAIPSLAFIAQCKSFLLSSSCCGINLHVYIILSIGLGSALQWLL